MKEDPRFVVDNNKIFKPVKKDKFKTHLDDRFKGILSEEKFNSLDKNSKKKLKNQLSDLYIAPGTVDEKEGDGKSTLEGNDKAGKKKRSGGKGSLEDRLDYLNKLSRGEISGDSSSYEEEDEEDEDAQDSSSSGEEEDIDEENERDTPLTAAAKRKSALQIPGDEDIPTGEETRRLAVMNCDWQSLRAADLMMVLLSFCPSGASLRSVTVYPSDFGIKAMEIDHKYAFPAVVCLSFHAADNSLGWDRKVFGIASSKAKLMKELMTTTRRTFTALSVLPRMEISFERRARRQLGL